MILDKHDKTEGNMKITFPLQMIFRYLATDVVWIVSETFPHHE